MTEQRIRAGKEKPLAAEWLLIMERLKVTDLAAWIAQFRRGDRTTNPVWASWEGVARRIYDDTGVTVTTNGLRARWSDEVDEVIALTAAALKRGELPDVPTRDQTVGSTGPAGSSGSELPAGSNPGEATP